MHGRETANHEWIKLRLMVGTQTKIVVSVDIRSSWLSSLTTTKVRYRGYLAFVFLLQAQRRI